MWFILKALKFIMSVHVITAKGQVMMAYELIQTKSHSMSRVHRVHFKTDIMDSIVTFMNFICFSCNFTTIGQSV